MRTKTSKPKALWLVGGMAVGLLLVLQACAPRRNLIAEGAYALVISPELTSSVDDVTVTKVNDTLTVAGRISSGAGIRPGCPGRIQIELIDPQGRLIDSRTAAYYPMQFT